MSGKQIALDVEESTTVSRIKINHVLQISQVKQMIEADQPAMTTDLQTLIAYGKKLEQNEKTLGEYEIKDGNFMIVMIAKVRFFTY